ncbi:MAG: fibronectin type III domain-containing protein, partial [bacterium]|nr:fibronectin type III domain-containing protein [bacterium]
MKWNYLITLVLILLVLLGCTPTPSTPPSSAPTAPTPVTPSVTPVPPSTESPKLTATPTLTPASTPPPTPTPTPTLPPDTTPPSAITGLVANNAYDGRVNLWWAKSATADFDHYNIYLNKAEMVDVTGMKAVQQIKDIATSRYQVTGLEDGTRYYFAVTAVDKSGNEGVRVASVSATPMPMPRGTVDPDISVDVYQSD